MAKLLEVIITSVEDAREAQAGGADRLELVRALESGGLTPDFALVREVLDTVRIPVRVMLRQTPNMLSGGLSELRVLRTCAEILARMPIDGVVMGFIHDGEPDLDAMHEILSAASNCRVTFHRAFDELADPHSSIRSLKTVPQIDRILTIGGDGDWTTRKQRLINWQSAAAPSIKILAGAGLSPIVLSDLAETEELQEIHVGRAARRLQSVTAPVSREAVRRLKRALS